MFQNQNLSVGLLKRQILTANNYKDLQEFTGVHTQFLTAMLVGAVLQFTLLLSRLQSKTCYGKFTFGCNWIKQLQIGSDRIRKDQIGSNRIGSDRIGQDRIGSDRIGQDRTGSDRIRQDHAGSDRIRRDQTGSDRMKIQENH